jgi:hypothetical protein
LVIERLILDFPHKMTEAVSAPYYRALVFCLARKQWSVRGATAATVKKLLGMLGGAQISLALIAEFAAMLETQSVSLQYSEPQDILPK